MFTVGLWYSVTCVASLFVCIRYTGHIGSEYKIDSSFTNDDTFVVSGSEDGKIYFWDLVEVMMSTGTV